MEMLANSQLVWFHIAKLREISPFAVVLIRCLILSSELETTVSSSVEENWQRIKATANGE
jgi:hypothetical protein